MELINTTKANRSVYVIASAGFCALIRQTSTPKPVGSLSARPCGYAARQKPARRPGSRRGLPLVSRFLPSRE